MKQTAVKRLSETRWSARADAVDGLAFGHKHVQVALDTISNEPNQDKNSAYKASALSRELLKLENIILTLVWNKILSRFNQARKIVQDEESDL